MPGQSSSHRKIPDNSPDVKKLLEYKLILENIRRQLSEIDLLRNSESAIQMYFIDVDRILRELYKLKDKKSVAGYFHSINAIYINVRDVKSELMLILNIIHMLNTPKFSIGRTRDTLHEIYQETYKCKQYLDEAISQFLI